MLIPRVPSRQHQIRTGEGWLVCRLAMPGIPRCARFPGRVVGRSGAAMGGVLGGRPASVRCLNPPALRRQIRDFATKPAQRPLDTMQIAVTILLLERAIFLEPDFPATTLPGRHRILTHVFGESKDHRKHGRRHQHDYIFDRGGPRLRNVCVTSVDTAILGAQT